MRKILSVTCVWVLLMLAGRRSFAQAYQTAAGLKFGGYENGFSVKYFTTPDIALEGVLGFRDHGVVVTGLYEFHQEAFGVRELRFYYGAGGHIGAEGSGVYRQFDGDDETFNKGKLLIGIDGVLGLEYRIPGSPVAVSLDLNPRAEFAIGPYFDLAPGLGLKYVF